MFQRRNLSTLTRVLAATASVALLGPALTACEGEPSAATNDSQASAEKPTVPPLKLSTGFRKPNAVPVDQAVRLSAEGGTLRAVKVTSPAGPLPGKLAKNDKSWIASGRLEPGVTYRIHYVGTRSDGKKVVRNTRFRTEDLTLDEQTYASVAPLSGETVGVGMPVIVTFDVPVTDKASIEKHMSVTSSPRQPGSWHWLSDQEAHFRPRTYWKPGSEVAVDVDINSIPAGAGIYGQESRHVEFDVGDSIVSRVNVETHRMKVFINGSLARTIPVSAGKKGWETRSGTKVIIEKHRKKRMNAATIGVDRDDPEYYNLNNVEYALRVTYSGEFLHAAPWSVGDQGSANVSHGCVGMSTSDAAWLYNLTLRGDVVEVTGTERYMEPGNGYADWNKSFAEYRSGSALS
ncbi:MAG: Ig-like domain-containing protein [Nocardioidaceae bacterium]